MSYFIIIRGPLGSGKSTIANKLADVLDAEYIGMDDVLDEHGLDTVPPGAPCIPAENFIKANECVVPHAKEQMEQGRIMIFDACYYHKEVIEHLIGALPFPHVVFTLKVPVDVCIERDRLRSKTYGKDAVRVVFDLVSRFDYGQNIDAAGNLEETVDKILAHLTPFQE